MGEGKRARWTDQLEALAVDEIDKEQYPLTGPLVASTCSLG
jgi:hypothetical protein